MLPGDTFDHATSSLIRVSPLNTPVMHPVRVRIHHFFVPNRITWPESEDGGWEQFITGGPDGMNAATVPTINTTSDKKSLLTYLGLPPTTVARTVSALPVRAANMIFNEFYRDQNLVSERALDDVTVPQIAWEKDYFTTARPWTQLGPQVSLPIGTSAEVKSKAAAGVAVNIKDGNTNVTHPLDASSPSLSMGAALPNMPDDNKLYADLAAGSTVNINDFRAAFSIQRYQEARARYGARFTEYLRYLGITPSDARLQRPEFLAGGGTRLNFSEVLQTSPGAGGEAGVGDLYGHGIAGVRSNRYRKFFEEHGYVISFMSTRPKSIYMNGAHRDWRKQTKEDFFQKELANLGQQEVERNEIYLDQTTGVFGYQDRYEEYRNHPSQVTQDFRDTLNSWHLARELGSGTALNADFVECKPSDRIFQVTSTDSLWCMVNHKIVARRMVPKRANPRII